MTFREKLMRDYPEYVDDSYIGGCRGCPCDRGYEGYRPCDANGIYHIGCRACWNREMPMTREEQEANDLAINAERGMMYWHSVTEQPPYRVGDPEYRGYLVCVDYGGEKMLCIADYTYEDPDDDLCSFHVDGEYEPGVTHWMMSPQLPEEE